MAVRVLASHPLVYSSMTNEKQFIPIRVIIIFLVLIAAVTNAAGQSAILGVLEDVPGVYFGEPNFRSVRIVFQKDSGNWHAFHNNCPDQNCLKTIASEFPPEVTWTVTYDGRNLGRVTGRTPKEFNFYSHVGLQEIVSGSSVPTIGKRSVEFGGFTEHSVYRPLVVNSQPYFMDPDSWKPSQFSAEFAGLLRQQFRRKFPKLCRVSKKDETKLEPFLYRDEEIKLVKGFESKRGWSLARLHLEEAVDCKNVEAGFEVDDPWFVVDPQHLVQYLESGMWLVDAGDYDNDGKSELVFSIDRYNRGGYELFYDDLKKHAVFEFSYH
jgi:hypothetical protein